MNRRSTFSVFIGSLVLTLPFTRSITGDTLVVPPELENAFGGVSDGGLFQDTPQFQQVYGAILFTSAPTDLIEITAAAFRLNETSHPNLTDVIIGEATFQLGVSAHPGYRMSDNLTNSVIVFSGSNLEFIAPANRPADEFDIVFQFQQPFTYDRRRGALVLQGALRRHSFLDTDAAYGTVERGYFLMSSPTAPTQLFWSVLATKFSYRAIPSIKSVQVLTNTAQIEFESPSPLSPKIEGASSVAGPYAPEPNVQFESAGTNLLKAIVPADGASRFWRISFQ